MDWKSLPPGDPALIDKIVQEYMSQGKFDELRKKMLAEVDTVVSLFLFCLDLFKTLGYSRRIIMSNNGWKIACGRIWTVSVGDQIYLKTN